MHQDAIDDRRLRDERTIRIALWFVGHRRGSTSKNGAPMRTALIRRTASRAVKPATGLRPPGSGQRFQPSGFTPSRRVNSIV